MDRRFHSVAIDLRPLADPRYRDRGIGRLAANLVRTAQSMTPDAASLDIVGILDRAHAPLDEAIRMLVDRMKGMTELPGRNVVFQPSLVVGDSCAPLR